MNNALDKKNDDICLLFGWFDDRLKDALKKSMETFWETKFQITTQSLTRNLSVKDDYISKGEIYFTLEMPIPPHQNAHIRLSSEFVRIMFHETFGSNSPVFKLQDLSELEIKILNSFCEFINDEIQTLIIPHDKIPKSELRDKGVYNTTFLISKNNQCAGKIVISLPKNCLDTKKTKLEENFKFDDFINTSTVVNILVGTSKIALNGLKSLQAGDIILLENSKINYMEIKSGKIKQGFKVNPEPSLMLELDENEHDLGADMADNKNIWDDIQIEVGAEFNKVKMTLGDLKQISKGLVIDLGEILNNKISLLVENKVVAKGELVIINDRYGVKIDEIISNTNENDTPKKEEIKGGKGGKKAQEPDISPEEVNKIAQEAAKEVLEDEEFDYSDFEEEDN